MKNPECERWDGDRVLMNPAFADVFCHHNLKTFADLMHYQGGSVAKNLLRERTTTRIELATPDGDTRAFYIKRHSRPPVKEYVKPLLRLTWPILGAENEWRAIHHFESAGIPTMTPVALGRNGGDSFLITESIEDCVKLSDWIQTLAEDSEKQAAAPRIFTSIGRTARRMHDAGLHHQDFYLYHLMVPRDDVHSKIVVIDLGRVRRQRKLSRRWIVKDLAQLQYSARDLPSELRDCFFDGYFGKSVARPEPITRRVNQKTRAIARHSHKNSL